MRRWLILFVFFTSFAYGQTPAYFRIGELELAGLQIYDIHQTDDLHYWLSTSDGIYEFDGYEFTKYFDKKMLSPSFFNLKTDLNGDIFANNLSGQIFRIKDNVCDLYYQIPDSLISSLVSFEFDEQNRIIIGGDKLFRVNKDKSLFTYPSTSRYSSISIGKVDNVIYATNGGINGTLTNLKIVNDSIISSVYTNVKKERNRTTFKYLEIDSEGYLFSSNTREFYKITDEQLIPVPFITYEKPFTFLTKRDNSIWAPSVSHGIHKVDLSKPLKDQTAPLLTDFFFSAIHKDKEENLVLGTFDQGLIVIPNTTITSLYLPKELREIKMISRNKGGNGILVGGMDGEIYTCDSLGHFTLLVDSNRSLDYISYIPKNEQLFIDYYDGTLIYPENAPPFTVNTSSVKDVVAISKYHYLIGLESGLVHASKNKESILIPWIHKDSLKSQNFVFRNRTNSVKIDSITKTLFIGSSSGLFIIKNAQMEEYLLNGEPVLTRDMEYLNGRTYITCNNFGILIFEGSKKVGHWNTENVLITNVVTELTSNNQYIFVITDKGIQILTQDGEPVYFLNKSNGLHSNRVTDIVATNKHLWIHHRQGIQKVELSGLKKDKIEAPKTTFSRIILNDSIVLPKESKANLRYFENSLTFRLSSITMRYREELSYAYQIKGLDYGWKYADYQDNVISYSRIPPGDYVFEAKSILKEKEGPITQFAFSISRPFWNEIWFIAILVIIILFIILSIFRREIRKQDARAQLQAELHQSKLVAIQAQMNPHFIFNALNSIQDLVLKNDSEKAYGYISKFAFLVRNILKQSETDWIDFSQELESLTLYLELEKLRFKKGFDFELIYDEKLDIQLPPMLIQPFVENSIAHGLLHKKGDKNVKITFELKDALICTITDNGIGRKKASLIKERQLNTNQSFAVSAIKKRLSILEKKYGGQLEVSYDDLTKSNESNEVIGTTVTLKIPFQQDV